MRYLVTYDHMHPTKGPKRYTKILKGTVEEWWTHLTMWAGEQGGEVHVINSELLVDKTWSTE